MNEEDKTLDELNNSLAKLQDSLENLNKVLREGLEKLRATNKKEPEIPTLGE